MEKLHEPTKRREDFQGGTPVVLADSQTWYFARPRVWFVPHDGNASGWRECLSLTDDDDFQDLLDERAKSFGEDGRAQTGAFLKTEFALARRMLAVNYDLTDAEFARIVRFGFEEEENPEGFRIRNEVQQVFLGLGPKPSPDGIESSLTPSGE